MYNVYKQIEIFYQKNNGAEQLIPQTDLEKYFRRLAWKNYSQDKQQTTWIVVEGFLAYMLAENYQTCTALFKYDFIQMFINLVKEKKGLKNSREQLVFFVEGVSDFLQYWQEADEQLEEVLLALKAAEKEFFTCGKYTLPIIFEDDLEYAENVFLTGKDEPDPFFEQEEADRMNVILERLMSKIADYYRTQEHWADLNRAMEIYLGPANEPSDQEDVSFWLGFWDYFFFDYHLIANDRSPLAEYYFRENNRLQLTERMVVRTLLGAEFRVFTIESIQGEFLTAVDMFSEERTVMPCPDFLASDTKKKILYGHVNATGTVMMSNITAIPASEKLQKRIKEELDRAYVSYNQQQATMVDIKVFLHRHAAAVRHIINIMAGFAQLKVIAPAQNQEKILPSPLYKEKILPFFRQEVLDMAAKIGYSYYAVQLIGKLHDDFSESALVEQNGENAKEIAAALFLTFAYANGMDFLPIRKIMNLLATDLTEANRLYEQIKKSLAILPGDTRYLTEEGFVHKLYMNLT